MRFATTVCCVTTAVLLGGGLAGSVAAADNVADFYKDKQVKIIVGGTPAGGYGSYARILSLHFGQYIPGKPQVLVQFMPGAGGLLASNYVYNAGPKDGTVIGSAQRDIVTLSLYGDKGVKYDPAKFNWIGSLYNDTSVCVSSQASGVKTIQDVMKRPLIIGAVGANANDTEQFPAVLNNVLGTKFKIVTGYSGPDLIMALERGEVSGRCGWSWDSLKSQQGTWLRDKKINILVQLSLKKVPEVGDVPLVTELVKTEEQKEVMELIFAGQTLGRPFMMAPEVPAERVTAVRKAFMAAADKELIGELNKMKFNISPINGEDMQAMVLEIFHTPKAIVDQARAAVVYKN